MAARRLLCAAGGPVAAEAASPGSSHFAALALTSPKPQTTFTIPLKPPFNHLALPLQLLVFMWRGEQIRDKSATLYDDRRGPLGLAATVVAALSLIFLVSLADLIHTIAHRNDPPPPGPAPAPAPAPAADAAAGVLRAGVGAAAAAARSLLGGA